MKNEKCLNEFLTVEEASVLKGGTPQGIRKAIKEERLLAQRKGRQWLILKTEFDKFIRSAV